MNNTIITDTTQPTNFKLPSFRLIWASQCKKFALQMAKELRPANKFTRVSRDFLESCENAMKDHIRNRVRSHPSNGKTLQ